jgi:hypothetical protein
LALEVKPEHLSTAAVVVAAAANDGPTEGLALEVKPTAAVIAAVAANEHECVVVAAVRNNFGNLEWRRSSLEFDKGGIKARYQRGRQSISYASICHKQSTSQPWMGH